jgi:hypothetical protein
MKNSIQYIPYTEISGLQTFIAVDCHHPMSKPLSHWKGAPTPIELMDDTSTGIVLNALHHEHEYLTTAHASNNHFDIDGFLGVWSLLNPDLALQYADTLRWLAELGDFRELNATSDQQDAIIRMAAWFNSVERQLFYKPFAAADLYGTEMQLSSEKYHYFLPRFEQVLLDPSLFESEYLLEYQEIMHGLEQMAAPETQIRFYQDIRLMVVQTKEPIHYYALFAQSKVADAVLAIYDGNRYELEYKYTSWIDTKNRFTYPRMHLNKLVETLNRMESAAERWRAEKITDTGPIMRLEQDRLSKKDYFDHPSKRTIYSSSIEPQQLEQLIVRFFEERWRGMQKKNNWSWQEIREVNDRAMKNYS